MELLINKCTHTQTPGSKAKMQLVTDHAELSLCHPNWQKWGRAVLCSARFQSRQLYALAAMYCVVRAPAV